MIAFLIPRQEPRTLAILPCQPGDPTTYHTFEVHYQIKHNLVDVVSVDKDHVFFSIPPYSAILLS